MMSQLRSHGSFHFSFYVERAFDSEAYLDTCSLLVVSSDQESTWKATVAIVYLHDLLLSRGDRFQICFAIKWCSFSQLALVVHGANGAISNLWGIWMINSEKIKRWQPESSLDSTNTDVIHELTALLKLQLLEVCKEAENHAHRAEACDQTSTLFGGRVELD